MEVLAVQRTTEGENKTPEREPTPAPGGGEAEDVSRSGGPTAKPAPRSGRRLDALVTKVAVQLMPVSEETLQTELEATLRTLTEFLGVDTSFLRRNDHSRRVSILAAEYPPRQDIPDPDPLGEVPFDNSDPVFAAIRDLKEPFVLRPTGSPDFYQERVRDGSGVNQVSLAMVPLVHDGTTKGVLGFIKFGDRPWSSDELNALQAIASLLVQLNARIEAEERLRYLAYHDELTGLGNRHALVSELCKRMDEQGEEETVFVLFVDVDRFKDMNDFLGRVAGDRVLVTIAERLRTSLRPDDYCARVGGDEFAVLLGERVGSHKALAVADRIRGSVAQAIDAGGYEVTRTTSVGIASGGAVIGCERVLTHADVALRSAKRRGGDVVVSFDEEMRAAAEERSELELSLRSAIDAGDLLLYYQPEFDLRTGNLLAVEALVRWQHPKRGLLPATAFIAVAEETNLVVDLGLWVLAEGCRQMAVWVKEAPQRSMTMRINVSPAQLTSLGFVSQVADCLSEHGVPGELICLEITEHAVMQDVSRSIGVLDELRALGITLAIDDFGTGFSSMTQLKRMPVSTLKIDRSFVSGLGTDTSDTALVDSIVKLAGSFGLDVVAEGVETIEMVRELQRLGCYRAQGYLLSRPKPVEDLVEVLSAGHLDRSILGLAENPG